MKKIVEKTCKYCKNELYVKWFGKAVFEYLDKPYGDIHHFRYNGKCYLHNMKTGEYKIIE